MTVMLLTEHHLEFQSVKGGCAGSSEAAMLEISCHGSMNLTVAFLFQLEKNEGKLLAFKVHIFYVKSTGFCFVFPLRWRDP